MRGRRQALGVLYDVVPSVAVRGLATLAPCSQASRAT